ncbi:hypothetical protein BT67DRAFT_436139 [Trichocladium antarcticum]|uniref:Uncharacterized protein n=1 Tax=Trichocladium antarcticum TaxID=1450529 RepID=A0AAN6ZBG4_9PEZI|nr:hypothetical protein BT67DRAFT_436139 [Trichocladium antarcticum]
MSTPPAAAGDGIQDIELTAMPTQGTADVDIDSHSHSSSGRSASLVTFVSAPQTPSEAASGTPPPPPPSLSDVDEYLAPFRARRRLVPHWRNVLESPRVELAGSILLLSFAPGEGVVSRETLSSRSRSDTPWADSSTLPAVFVLDVSSWVMNTLGPVFDLSPETFERHLVQSGYSASSYEDPDPSTWPTRFMPAPHASLRWFSLVVRRSIEPSDMVSRRELIGGGMRWDRTIIRRGDSRRPVFKRQLRTATNIFRREWPVAAVYRPPRRRLSPGGSFGRRVEIVDERRPGVYGDDPLSDDDDDDDDGPDIVAWEERVTFCWGSRGQQLHPIFLFDPLPHLHSHASHAEPVTRPVLPFSKRLAPRQPPPPVRLDSNPATLRTAHHYATAVDDAAHDAAAWLDRLSRSPAARSPLDLQLLAVLHVVRQDTVAFLEHMGRILDQLTAAGSLDDRTMQEQLGHRRALLGRFQAELAALGKSLAGFFAYPYHQDRDGAAATTPSPTPSPSPSPSPSPAPELTAALHALQTDMAAMADRCERLQHVFTADMSLLESKRGIAEAESVSRLTELAFLFIPLTFAASLFSMQLRELDANPPPVYAFVIAAAATVAASYGLRLVQRSTMLGGVWHRAAQRIRADTGVTTRKIPTRAMIGWAAPKLLGKPLVVAGAGCALILVAATLWARTAMDVSFKAAVTAIAVLSILLALLVGLTTRGRVRNSNTFGFGPVWQTQTPASRPAV